MISFKITINKISKKLIFTSCKLELYETVLSIFWVSAIISFFFMQYKNILF